MTPLLDLTYTTMIVNYECTILESLNLRITKAVKCSCKKLENVPFTFACLHNYDCKFLAKGKHKAVKFYCKTL